MSTYTVTVDPMDINFAPGTIVEEIHQNILTIITTMMHSVPLHRTFGINPEFLDDTTEVAKTRIVVEIMEKVEQFEPRAFVEEVKFVTDHAEGKLKPTVIFSIKSEVVT